MHYSEVGVLSLLIHLIINFNILFKRIPSDRIPASLAYKKFLYTLIVFYIVDITWGILTCFNLKYISFYETEIYFMVMAFVILQWTRFVIEYIKDRIGFTIFLKYCGAIFIAAQTVILIINIFIPIAFWFDDNGNYHTGRARHFSMLFQFLMFLATTIYMTAAVFKTSGKIKLRYRAIEMFGIVMTIFIALQFLDFNTPFYSIGFLLGTCIIHTFVVEDERSSRQEELHRLMQIEKIQEIEISSARQIAFRDPLTGVKSKAAYQEDCQGIDNRTKKGLLDDFGLIVFDVNDLKKTNDTKGHEEGDKIIRAASNIICQTFKHSPVYRIGGDEFVAFLLGEDYKNKSRLLAAFNKKIDDNKKQGLVVISDGFADFKAEKSASFAELFKIADKRMYERKKELKNQL